MKWTVTNAKSKLGEVIRRAEKEGTQEITRRGQTGSVVTSAGVKRRKIKREGTWQSFSRTRRCAARA